MKVAVVQHDIAWGDGPATRRALAPRVAAAAGAGAGLVVLTELFATGFAVAAEQVAAMAEDEGGPTSAWLREQAARHGVWVCGSVAERAAGDEAGKPRNVFVLAGPGGEAHRYAKIHPFGYGGETETFGAGDEVVTVAVGDLRITPFVCYDLRFADAFWAVAERTDAYVVVANWPASRRAHWRGLLRARAIENQAWVVGANRVGEGGRLGYAGDSAVVDPFGETVAEAGSGEAVLTADVDPARVAAVREKFRFLPDRRPFRVAPTR